jgi:hypothetical protein
MQYRQQKASKLPMAAMTAVPTVFSIINEHNYVLSEVFEA